MQAVKVKLGTEEFIGMGTTFKAAKQDCATKALADSKLPKPPERKTLKARPVGITATQELHELATKKGLEAKFKFLEPYNFEFKASMRLWSKEEMRGNYRVQLTCGELYSFCALQIHGYNDFILKIPASLEKCRLFRNSKYSYR